MSPPGPLAGLLLTAALGVYLYRNGAAVWPYLERTPGDFGNYFRAASELLGGRSPFLPHFDYPPLLAFLLTPFATLGLYGARVAWFFASHACLLGAALLFVRPAGNDRAAWIAVAAVWALSGTVAENLALGQIQPFLLLLLAAASRFDGEHPSRAAAALGLATALKLWPGLLLVRFLAGWSLRPLSVGIAVAALGIFVPLAALRLLWPPPHLPTRGGYWLGTPASLNFSLPALALRASDPERVTDAPPPLSWQQGNNPEIFALAPERRRLSAAVSVATLAVGLLAIGLAARRGLARGGEENGPWILAALTALATLASPISWYHYQIFQLPGLALLAAAFVRRRSWMALAALVALAMGLTRQEVRHFFLGAGTAGEILTAGAVVVGCNVLLVGWLVWAIGSTRLPANNQGSRSAQRGLMQ